MMPDSRGCRDLREGRRKEGANAKSQSRREEGEKGTVVGSRGMGILPMTFHGRDARSTSKTERLPPDHVFPANK